jgi:hypothetical protein
MSSSSGLRRRLGSAWILLMLHIMQRFAIIIVMVSASACVENAVDDHAPIPP